jgi:hypothetical protein
MDLEKHLLGEVLRRRAVAEQSERQAEYVIEVALEESRERLGFSLPDALENPSIERRAQVAPRWLFRSARLRALRRPRTSLYGVGAIVCRPG